MSRHPYEILIGPLLTEKATGAQTRTSPQYTFKVATDSNKIEIRRAIEGIFNVRVVDVNTMNVHGKARRRSHRYRLGHTARWKKAVVTLAQGSSIDILEGGL